MSSYFSKYEIESYFPVLRVKIIDKIWNTAALLENYFVRSFLYVHLPIILPCLVRFHEDDLFEFTQRNLFDQEL